MVSKASEDLPDPDSPVMTVRLFLGISTSTLRRLCSRAPRTLIFSMKVPNSVGDEQRSPAAAFTSEQS